jgi:hypothetical protein
MNSKPPALTGGLSFSDLELLNTLHVFAGFGIDTDDVALFDEEGDVE